LIYNEEPIWIRQTTYNFTPSRMG